MVARRSSRCFLQLRLVDIFQCRHGVIARHEQGDFRMQALILDLGVLLFFLPYTYVYHWGYDLVREWLMLRRPLDRAS